MENKVFIHKENWYAKIQIPIMEIGKYRETTENDKYKIWPRSARDTVEIWPFETYREAAEECKASGRSVDCIKVI